MSSLAGKEARCRNLICVHFVVHTAVLVHFAAHIVVATFAFVELRRSSAADLLMTLEGVLVVVCSVAYRSLPVVQMDSNMTAQAPCLSWLSELAQAQSVSIPPPAYQLRSQISETEISRLFR